MVEFDRSRGAIGSGATFNHIGIEGALRKVLCPVDLERFFFKAFDERMPDAAAFLLRVADTTECTEKAFFGVDDAQVGFEVFGEFADDGGLFVFS